MSTTRTESSKVSVKLTVLLAAFCAVIGATYMVRDLNQAGIASHESKVKQMKQKAGDCRFVMYASWSPPSRLDVSVTYRFGAERGSPTVRQSPWTLARRGPCSTPVSIGVAQTVYHRRRAGCRITVDRVIVDRVGPVPTREFQCNY